MLGAVTTEVRGLCTCRCPSPCSNGRARTGAAAASSPQPPALGRAVSPGTPLVGAVCVSGAGDVLTPGSEAGTGVRAVPGQLGRSVRSCASAPRPSEAGSGAPWALRLLSLVFLSFFPRLPLGSVIESSVPSAAVGQVAAGRPQEDRGAGSDGWVDGGLQGRTDGRLGGGTAAWRRALLPGEGPGAGGCDPRSPPPPRSAPLTRCPSRRASSIASPPPAPPCLTSPAPGRWGAARISTSSSKRWVSSGRRAGWGNEPMEGAPGSRSSAVPGAPGRARGCGTGKSASPARGSRGRAGCALLLTCKGRRSCPGAQPPCSARSRGFSARGCSAAFPPPAPSRTSAGWAWRPQALLPSRFAQVSTPCSGRWRWRPPPNPTWRSARTGTSSTSKLPPLSAPRKSTSKSGRASRRRRWMAENAG